MLNVKALLTKILGKLSDIKPLVVEQKVLVDNLTIAANGYGDAQGSVSKSGYTVLGLVGVRTENASSGGTLNTYCMIQRFSMTSSTNAHCVLRNFSTSAAKVKVTVAVLYREN